jgi:hypothetical protein
VPEQREAVHWYAKRSASVCVRFFHAFPRYVAPSNESQTNGSLSRSEGALMNELGECQKCFVCFRSRCELIMTTSWERKLGAHCDRMYQQQVSCRMRDRTRRRTATPATSFRNVVNSCGAQAAVRARKTCERPRMRDLGKGRIAKPARTRIHACSIV